jgi:hypothetical protein
LNERYIPENLEDLINFGVAREEWSSGAHLSEDYSNRPHIYTSRVLPASKKNLRGTIPQCDNLAVELVS